MAHAVSHVVSHVTSSVLMLAQYKLQDEKKNLEKQLAGLCVICIFPFRCSATDLQGLEK